MTPLNDLIVYEQTGQKHTTNHTK